MKNLVITLIALISLTNVYAMSENDNTACGKMNQDSAYQEKVTVKVDPLKVETNKNIKK